MASRDAEINAPDEQQTPAQIVCVYAQSDQQWYEDLKTYLVLWEQANKIIWLDTQAGAETMQTMQDHLKCADLILLLLSPTFFAVHPCYTGMLLALQEKEQRQVPVIPIIARACDWKESACGGLKALPRPALPLAQWTHAEQAYEQIRVGLARLVPGLSIDGQLVRPRLFQARDLPKGYVPRPKAFDEIKHLLLNHQNNQTTAITTALRGAGGFGKTTLALAVCHDSEIQAAFYDGILWVELGEQPPRPLDVLNSVLASLDRSLSEAISLEEARDHWRMALQGRVCLLVIDDVWQAEALEPLLEGGPQCVRLVTTRNDQVLPEETAKVWIDAMKLEEAILVLSRGLPEEIQQAVYQFTLEKLAIRLGCWPLLLSLAHGLLAEQVSYGRAIVQALENVKQAYQDCGVTAFDVGQATTRRQAVHASLDVSLHHLEEFTPARYQASRRYQELAVFPEDTDIPLTTLQIFWQATNGLKSWETEDLCIRLHRLSLLLTCDLGQGTIRLHDVIRNYLQVKVTSLLPVLHQQLLDSYALTHWADLSPEEPYLWEHLAEHLLAAHRKEALHAMLIDGSFLIAPIRHGGVAKAQKDLGLVSENYTFRQIASAIRAGAVILRQTPEELWNQVKGRVDIALQASLPRQMPHLDLCFNTLLHADEALVHIFAGHAEEVYQCAFSPNGQQVLSSEGSPDYTLRLWDIKSGATVHVFEGHTNIVYYCAFNPDGMQILSASSDKTLRLWDVESGKTLRVFKKPEGSVYGCAFNPDGIQILSASSDKTLRLWDVESGAIIRVFEGHIWRHQSSDSSINDCAFSPDGMQILSASDDETLRLWDVGSGKTLRVFKGHEYAVNGCAFSPNGQQILSASADETLRLWDVENGKTLRVFKGHKNPVNGCAFSPDGRWMLSASGDDDLLSRNISALWLWDVASGKILHIFEGHKGSVNGCVFSPDGQQVLSSSYDGARLWDVASGKILHIFGGHKDSLEGWVFSPDGKRVLGTLGAEGEDILQLWNVANGKTLRIFKGHTHFLSGCAFSPNGRQALSVSVDKTLRLWDVKSGRELARWTTDAKLNCCAFSPNGKTVIVGDSTGGSHFLSIIME